MAYRRRHAGSSPATFTENAPSSPPREDSSSLATAAIHASSLHRDSSFSVAYGESVVSFDHKDTPKQRESPAEQASSTCEFTSLRTLDDSKPGFWGILARKAKNIFEEDNSEAKFESLGRFGPCSSVSSSGVKSNQSSEVPQKAENPMVQNGLGAITSSLNYIGGTIGNALGEGLTVVESKAADIISDTSKLHIRRKGNAYDARTQQASHSNERVLQAPANNAPVQADRIRYVPAISTPSTLADYETQLKASRDVANAMAAKAKLLLRELKTVKSDLAFAKQRCTQLEEENRILRESTQKGDSPEDDDLIRLQLETLLAEKARLANENSVYARENRFLREVVEYHQLTMQGVIYLDEGIDEDTEMFPITAPFESEVNEASSPTSLVSPATPAV